MADADRCVNCGEIIPEGRMACPICLVYSPRAEKELKTHTFGHRFSFPENVDTTFDSSVNRVTQKLCVQFLDEYDDYIVSQIANTAKENGVSELAVLNKKVIIDALNKRMPKKPVDLAKNELYGNCAGCGRVVHVGNRYCDQCGQKLDWGEEDGN